MAAASSGAHFYGLLAVQHVTNGLPIDGTAPMTQPAIYLPIIQP